MTRVLALVLLTVVGVAPTAREVCGALCHVPAGSTDVVAHQGHHGEHHAVSVTTAPDAGPVLASPPLGCGHDSDATSVSIVAAKRDAPAPSALPQTIVAAALAPAGAVVSVRTPARDPVPIAIRTPLRV